MKRTYYPLLIVLFILLWQCRPVSIKVKPTLQSYTGSPEPTWSEAVNTFILPVEGNTHIYYSDIQASFAEVDWQTLDRLYIPAGDYDFINMSNLPVRTMDRPLVITNYGGQVRIGADHYYTASLNGGAGWVFTGRYNKRLKTGDAGYTGHMNGRYANSTGTYGIEISHSNASGIGIGGRATDFELDYIEIGHVGFAGLLIKTNDDPTALMDNVKIHDLYIHDTESEGVYIGNTAGDPNTQHKITNLKFYNNRVIRSGTEGLQLVNMGDGVEVYNNVFFLNALAWKDTFQIYQDGCFQYGSRAGRSSIHHNIFIGSANHLFIIGLSAGAGEVLTLGVDRVYVHDNYFSHSRDFFGYILRRDSNQVTTLRFENNYISNINFHYNEISPDTTDSNTIFRASNNKQNPQEYINNYWSGPEKFIDYFTETNMTVGPVTSAGNVNEPIARIVFNNVSLPDDFDYHRIERWVGRSELYDIDVYYETGDYVMYGTTLYECIEAGSHTNKVPPDNPATWKALSPAADDVRLCPCSPYQGIGLMDTIR